MISKYEFDQTLAHERRHRFTRMRSRQYDDHTEEILAIDFRWFFHLVDGYEIESSILLKCNRQRKLVYKFQPKKNRLYFTSEFPMDVLLNVPENLFSRTVR